MWAVKWRSADGKRLRRRLGGAAWVVKADNGRWRPRAGRPVARQLTEFQARRRMSDLVRAVEVERADRRARAASAAALAEAAGGPTFRSLAHAWLAHLADVDGAKPSTLRDYRSMLAEPGIPHRRGPGRTIGRIMAALGDMAAAEVTTLFNYGLRPENVQRWGLTGNSAAATAKRREDGPARLEVFTGEQVEALARTGESGAWRNPADRARADRGLRAEEDRQLAELLRVAAYTGLRRGELVALRWSDVRQRSACLSCNAPSRPPSRERPRVAVRGSSRLASRRLRRSTTSRGAPTHWR